MTYAIIALGGKQYRVQPGERLLVDRLRVDEGEALSPTVLLVGGNGEADLSPKATVTARVVKHVRGDKVRIGKYKRRTGYRRHTGFRASLSQIEIEAIGAEKAAKPRAAAEKPKAAPPRKADAAPTRAAAAPRAEAAPKGLPKGYADMTVAQVAEGAKAWNRPMLEAALEYEREHGKRKGAISALESAIARKEES